MKSWLSIVLSVVILIGGGTSVYLLNGKWDDPVVVNASKLGKPGVQVKLASHEADLKELIREDQKKVVSVEVVLEDGSSTGSGFLFNDKGDIVTNAHVVEDAQSITVKAFDTSLYTGKLIGVSKEKDVAVIRVEGLAGRDPLELETSKEAEVGDEVMAFGSPLGLDNTVTTGIISGVGRDVDTESTSYKGAYQISAPITHGNSGGPLVLRSNGKVIGINSAGNDQGSIGFSIPIGQVTSMIEEWSQHPDEALSAKMSSVVGGVQSGSGYTKETMSSAAKYLVQYFYDSLAQKDYVTAYTLLGSDWQTKTDYEKFRKGYLYTLGVTVKHIIIKSADTESAVVSAVIEATEDAKSGETVLNSYNVTYTVKLENGTLKIISGKGKKL
ncbi:peptidase S1 [Paenibacillus baekrokdamisoli]|uniref:Peptidase S1 n=1 Tax=Paenibacillus baekrokdamisoli TaxID=1712516 RepID=A0A3G9J1R3_9BACL|nr:trypsin-like peptidase domain-containing protein [Paenibacillus baekrokdamisoli]MBB3072624.1 S1-C subfamily serine protease [Paenibacillus baekrokdamisoli]BBH22325.1 peptidase S1 [Paenibacillus baekrokdamisoli]